MTRFGLLLILAISLGLISAATVPAQKYRDAVKECNADPKTAYQMDFKKPPPTEYTPQLGAHSLCISKKIGAINEDGKVVEEHLRETFRKFTDDENKINSTIQECLKKHPTLEETAFHLYRCSAEFMKPYRKTSTSRVPDERYRNAVKECNADPKTAYKMDFKKPPPTEYTPQLGAHSLCISKKMGAMNEDGKVVEEHLRETFRKFTDDEDKINSTVQECLKEQPTQEETAFHLYRCSAEIMKLSVKISPADKRYWDVVKECNADPKTAYEMDFKKPQPTEYTPQLGAHSLCISKKVGAMTEDGQVVEEHLRETFRKFTDDENKIDSTVLECLRKQPTAEETAFHLYRCSAEFMKLSPKVQRESVYTRFG